MKRISAKSITLGAAAVAIIGAPLATLSAANADTSTTSGAIPSSVLKADKLQAAATVLHTTTANVQTARKDHTVNSLIAAQHLTPREYRKDVRHQIAKELKAAGYSDTQIKAAAKTVRIHRVAHLLKHLKNSK